ncbi:MAG: AMIN domain-containing protein [Sulfuricurvum sp.]|nr:AMIN domain-containing protein [Sulfuricurvum sp.]
MKYSLILSLLLTVSSMGRENPFFALDPSKTQKITSNVIESKPPLNSVSYTLPDQARILKEVTFTIQNIDGSIESHKMAVDQSVDWHRPLQLSQSGVQTAKSAQHNSSSSADFGFIRFTTNGKTLTINTTDPLSRHFVLSDPNRIVLDFKRSASFRSEKKHLNAAPFKSVVMSNHNQFVRATITLDGRYSYTLNQSGNNIIVNCK